MSCPRAVDGNLRSCATTRTPPPPHSRANSKQSNAIASLGQHRSLHRAILGELGRDTDEGACYQSELI
jgi:hypothetical protein